MEKFKRFLFSRAPQVFVVIKKVFALSYRAAMETKKEKKKNFRSECESTRLLITEM